MPKVTELKRKSKQPKRRNVKDVFIILVVAFGSFYIGILAGVKMGYHQADLEFKEQKQLINVRNLADRKAELSWLNKAQENVNANENEEDRVGKGAVSGGGGSNEARFGTGFESFLGGMSYVSREQFATKYDMGIPLDESTKENNNVLLLHAQNSLPTTSRSKAESNTAIPYIHNVDEATQNCNTLKIVLTQPNNGDSCIAILGQYESYHVQKFMRLPKPIPGERKPQGLTLDAPLRLVNRQAKRNGGLSVKVPTWTQTLEYWKTLPTYLNTLDGTLSILKPILSKIAKNNVILVMVVNHGQSELLINFICNSKSKGFDLSNLLIFATDIETKDLVEGMGYTAFYDETNFGDIPKQAAERYANKTFRAVMMAKVYCVQMVNALGYDLLFQDVDMIWYRDPIKFFIDDKNEFDMYFQDDGNHAAFYAPYSANTGFYFVRCNDKTRHFFSSLLLSGSLIISTSSHQIALIALLSEHASMYGLRVKTLSARDGLFPGGKAYHQANKDYMKDLITGKVSTPEDSDSLIANNNRGSNYYSTQNINGKKEHPFIFHMSWTHNKVDKIKYFQQMNEWYLNNDQCMDSDHGNSEMKSVANIQGGGDISSKCCLDQPLFVCHYSDKASFKPCKDSPPKDKGRKSFW